MRSDPNKIGHKFTSRKIEYTLVDIKVETSYVTGEITRDVYIAEYTFCGQLMRKEMPASTVTRAALRQSA